MTKDIIIPEIVKNIPINSKDNNIIINLKRVENKQQYSYTSTTSNTTTTNNITNNNRGGLFYYIFQVIKLPFMIIGYIYKKIFNQELKTVYKDYRAKSKIQTRERNYYKKISKIMDSSDELF